MAASGSVGQKREVGSGLVGQDFGVASGLVGQVSGVALACVVVLWNTGAGPGGVLFGCYGMDACCRGLGKGLGREE